MKKIVAVCCCFAIFITLCGCKKNDVNSTVTTSDQSVSSKLLTSDNANNSESNSNDSADKETSNVSDTATITQKPTSEHIHSFSKKKVDPTCKSEGYTEYICSCGYSYQSDMIPPAHNYNKYYCTYCGQVDKSLPNILVGLGAFICNYGELAGNGIYTIYPNEYSPVWMSSYEDDFSIFSFGTHETDCIFGINFIRFNNKEAHLNYWDYKTGYEGSSTISINDFCQETFTKFDSLVCNGKDVEDQTEALNLFKPKIDNYMHAFENQLLAKAGLTLRDIGFYKY